MTTRTRKEPLLRQYARHSSSRRAFLAESLSARADDVVRAVLMDGNLIECNDPGVKRAAAAALLETKTTARLGTAQQRTNRGARTRSTRSRVAKVRERAARLRGCEARRELGGAQQGGE
jgi:hypothetical protein